MFIGDETMGKEIMGVVILVVKRSETQMIRSEMTGSRLVEYGDLNHEYTLM